MPCASSVLRMYSALRTSASAIELADALLAGDQAAQGRMQACSHVHAGTHVACSSDCAVGDSCSSSLPRSADGCIDKAIPHACAFASLSSRTSHSDSFCTANTVGGHHDLRSGRLRSTLAAMLLLGLTPCYCIVAPRPAAVWSSNCSKAWRRAIGLWLEGKQPCFRLLLKGCHLSVE